MARVRLSRRLLRWIYPLTLAGLLGLGWVYETVTGGNVLHLFFEPTVKPPVWKPLEGDQIRSTDPAFLRGVAAYNRNDLSEAYALWLPLAQAGDAEAQYQVGRLLRHGWGVEQNYAQAKFWLETAAKKQHAGAIGSLGYMHSHGLGVPMNKFYAHKLYEKSMNLGDKISKFNYGLGLYFGKDVIPDIERAIELMLELSHDGYCPSNYILGDFYKDPPNFADQDLEVAYRYYKKAQAGGCDVEAARTLLRWRLSSDIVRKVDEEFTESRRKLN